MCITDLFSCNFCTHQIKVQLAYLFTPSQKNNSQNSAFCQSVLLKRDDDDENCLLCQIFTKFDNFWPEDGQDNKIT